MNPIVTIALVGTARQGQMQAATDTPVDALISALPEGEAERKLLLSAGALALYRQAGYLPALIADAAEPAAPEKLRGCSAAGALLLSRLFSGEHSNLLSEALAYMRERGIYLPYALLPQALQSGTGDKGLRALLFPVLGERGYWLSRFNSAWNWVANYLPADQVGLPVEAETLWQEGTPAQRTEILSRLRAVDPEQARSWLMAVWKKENAEVRSTMLRTLETGLSTADEVFLERALDDRAAGVRATSAHLLARLPDTAFGARMRTLGQSVLSLKNSELVIKPPATFNPDWERDGLLEKPQGQLGKRAWWLVQILALIPPTFWETHLGATPETLLPLVQADKWGTNVIDGWSRAALAYDAPNWITPLWHWWDERPAEETGSQTMKDSMLREKLLARLPAKEAEALLLAFLSAGRGEQEDNQTNLLHALPKPWSSEFSRAYLQMLRDHCSSERLELENEKYNPYADPWFYELLSLAQALPIASLSEVGEPWELPNKGDWKTTYINSELRKFIEIVQMRQKIYEEII